MKIRVPTQMLAPFGFFPGFEDKLTFGTCELIPISETDNEAVKVNLNQSQGQSHLELQGRRPLDRHLNMPDLAIADLCMGWHGNLRKTMCC